jgi:hypothetical protein
MARVALESGRQRFDFGDRLQGFPPTLYLAGRGFDWLSHIVRSESGWLNSDYGWQVTYCIGNPGFQGPATAMHLLELYVSATPCAEATVRMRLNGSERVETLVALNVGDVLDTFVRHALG